MQAVHIDAHIMCVCVLSFCLPSMVDIGNIVLAFGELVITIGSVKTDSLSDGGYSDEFDFRVTPQIELALEALSPVFS